ncbi:phenylalanine--tRNA ligase [Actibacterium mucosum KCTC 23349]|uniref:Phenylalanine--tRNA ligase n=1 Tax=Actibacterium mucosum KCTC 23349 TaxID=1454373 RepID=A0A037ZEP6_9RHOB|nr:DM13 domain-containing protein [Actibacterium mucosum]KAJ53991.1 phenylalanine--tRNA ligase [Actibacterium mucosum KCTC 23349]
MRRLIIWLVTHGVAVAFGFALGIYLLPILTAPPSPDAAELEQSASDAMFTADLTRELRGSDFVHWGEGSISIAADKIVHMGKLAPGPDYKLYLVPEFVDHEDAFEPIKASAVQVGDVKTFDGFILDVPAGIDVTQYNTVLVWCEAFAEFITAAQYR